MESVGAIDRGGLAIISGLRPVRRESGTVEHVCDVAFPAVVREAAKKYGVTCQWLGLDSEADGSGYLWPEQTACGAVIFGSDGDSGRVRGVLNAVHLVLGYPAALYRRARSEPFRLVTLPLARGKEAAEEGYAVEGSASLDVSTLYGLLLSQLPVVDSESTTGASVTREVGRVSLRSSPGFFAGWARHVRRKEKPTGA